MISKEPTRAELQRAVASATKLTHVLQVLQHLPPGLEFGHFFSHFGTLLGLVDSEQYDKVFAVADDALAEIDAAIGRAGLLEELIAFKGVVAANGFKAALALERFEVALGYAEADVQAHADATPPSYGLARAHNNRALARQELGRLVEAEADYEAALAAIGDSEDEGLRALQRTIEGNLGTLRMQRGEAPLRSPEALRSTRDLPWRSVIDGDVGELVARLTSQAMDLLHVAGAEQALPLARQAFELAEEHTVPAKPHGIAASNYGYCLWRLQRLDDAVAVIGRAKELHGGAEGCQQPFAIDCYHLGLAYQDQKRYGDALAEFKLGWDAVRQVAPRSLTALNLLTQIGLYRMHAKDDRRARAAFERGMGLYEGMRADLADTEGKHEDTFRAYRGLLQRFLWLADRDDWTDEVFLLIERGKARFWLESVDRTLSASLPFLPPGAGNSPRPDTPSGRGVASDLTVRPPVSTAFDQRALRSLLGERGLLFHFFVGPDDMCVSFSSQGLLDHYRVDVNEAQLRDLVGRRLSAFGEANGSRARGLGACPSSTHAAFLREMGELLFPVSSSLFEGARQIVVLPDGPLWSLPFDCLEVRRPGGWCRLGEVAPVFVAPSVTALGRLRQRASVSSPDGTYFLIVSEPSIGRLMPALPGARAEAAWLRRAVSTNVAWLEGDDATPANVAPQLVRASHVHVASHAYGDPADDLPHLLLADGRSGPAKLFAHEVAGLYMRAKLVYLSACSTSMGRASTGEGLVSLARAFLMAGARCVVASLWPVDDDEALLLSRSFYEAYLSGHSPAAAMREAKATLLRTGAGGATASAFQVFGDGATV